MYFIKTESFVFSDLSHCTNALPVLKSSFFQFYFVLWLELQAILKAADRQIEVLGDVRSAQEKEIIITDQAFVV